MLKCFNKSRRVLEKKGVITTTTLPEREKIKTVVTETKEVKKKTEKNKES